MLTLTGEKVFLRALEPSDLNFLYNLENDMSLWNVSQSQTPYSKFVLKRYLDNAQEDVYTAKQLRLVICDKQSKTAVGLIDIFDFDPQHLRAGIGIIVLENSRKTGFAKDSIKIVLEYCFSKLNLHQIFANIDPANTNSVSLFANFGFKCAGIKKDWNLMDNKFNDEALYQLIKSFDK